jgi:hypothetical protein
LKPKKDLQSFSGTQRFINIIGGNLRRGRGRIMKKPYSGRKLDIGWAIYSLQKKGCRITNQLNIASGTETKEVDVRSAKNMGNKSWGIVDFLVNWKGFILIKN